MQQRQGRVLRWIVGAAAGLEILAGLGFALLVGGSSDPLGAAIGRGVIQLTAIPLCAGPIPALFLVWRGKLPFLGLALVIAAPLLWLYLMAHA